MGFLLGAYGKLAAGSRYRSLQARMMRIQSKIRRASRDVANMEKMIDRQQKSMEQSLTATSNATKTMYSQIMQAGMMGSAEYTTANTKLQAYYSDPEKNKLSDTELQSYTNTISQTNAKYSSITSQMTSMLDTQTAMSKTQIENYIENLRDTMLEPLKDEEDSLQLEKDTLESQIQVAKADYEACQKMEQADVKMLTPNYTGGQG